MSNQNASFGAAEIRRQISSGEISPIDVVETHLAQIEKVNPIINALVTPTFTKAAKKPGRLGNYLQKSLIICLSCSECR